MAACEVFDWCAGEHHETGDHAGYIYGSRDGEEIIKATAMVDQRPGVENDKPRIDFETPDEWWAESQDELNDEIQRAARDLFAIHLRATAMFKAAAS